MHNYPVSVGAGRVKRLCVGGTVSTPASSLPRAPGNCTLPAQCACLLHRCPRSPGARDHSVAAKNFYMYSVHKFYLILLQKLGLSNYV